MPSIRTWGLGPLCPRLLCRTPARSEGGHPRGLALPIPGLAPVPITAIAPSSLHP